MKKVYSCIYKQGEIRGKINIAVGSFSDPETVLFRLFAFKNKILPQGEEKIELQHVRENKREKSYEHDWKKIGENYVCKDCGIVGKRTDPFHKVIPIRTDKKFINCKWKIK